jgi:hypothetical protein
MTQILHDEHSGWFPFDILKGDPTTYPDLLVLGAVPIPRAMPWWWELVSIQLDVTVAFARDISFAGGGTTAEIIIGASFSYSKLITLLKTGCTTQQRCVPGLAWAAGLPGIGDTSTLPTPPTTTVSYRNLLNGTDQSGSPATFTITPAFTFWIFDGDPSGIVCDGSGNYYPGMLFKMFYGGTADIANYPAGCPDLGATSDNVQPPPVNSGGDPTDPAFPGGIPYGNVGTGTWDGLSFPIYGYTGAYVPPADTPDGDTYTGGDTLSVSATITPNY